MSSTTIDLSTLPAPDIVEQLDYMTIFQAMFTHLQSLDPTFTALVESDPAWKILEICAYREMLLRQRVNDGCRAVMLPYATGSDLDQLASLFGVVRKTNEDDTDLRSRTQLSLESLSTAGPQGAYISNAIAVEGVQGASVVGPPTVAPGNVLVTLLGPTGSGVVTADVITAVQAALSAADVRPLTDQVTVQSVNVANYNVVATIYTLAGPDSSVVLANAQTSIQAYVTQQRQIGYTVPLSGIYAALHVAGVERVVLTAPTADLTTDYQTVPYCTGIEIDYGGVSE